MTTGWRCGGGKLNHQIQQFSNNNFGYILWKVLISCGLTCKLQQKHFILRWHSYEHHILFLQADMTNFDHRTWRSMFCRFWNYLQVIQAFPMRLSAQVGQCFPRTTKEDPSVFIHVGYIWIYIWSVTIHKNHGLLNIWGLKSRFCMLSAYFNLK